VIASIDDCDIVSAAAPEANTIGTKLAVPTQSGDESIIDPATAVWQYAA
jgi:hypothetical protein